MSSFDVTYTKVVTETVEIDEESYEILCKMAERDGYINDPQTEEEQKAYNEFWACAQWHVDFNKRRGYNDDLYNIIGYEIAGCQIQF